MFEWLDWTDFAVFDQVFPRDLMCLDDFGIDFGLPDPRLGLVEITIVSAEERSVCPPPLLDLNSFAARFADFTASPSW